MVEVLNVGLDDVVARLRAIVSQQGRWLTKACWCHNASIANFLMVDIGSRGESS
jgi:hypothetical protein